MIHYRRVPRSFASLRMTVARQGSPILDPYLRSQPLRGCAPTATLSGIAAVKLKPLKNLRPEGPSTLTSHRDVSFLDNFSGR